MNSAFYSNPTYKKKQSEITRSNWQKGTYSCLKKVVKSRYCKNPLCARQFAVKGSQSQQYCSRHCSVLVNNRFRVSPMDKNELEKLYKSGLSITDISKQKQVSAHKVAYWMNQFNLPRRSLSEAVYLKCHPNGDPFSFKNPSTMEEAKLLGLGLGIYWGEGNKLHKSSIRLGNTDPDLMNVFIKFMTDICGVNKDDLKFGLQIFTDIDAQTAINYWTERLSINRNQLYKPIVTKSNSLGTYRKKSVYGVIMLNYHNRKLRDLIVGMLPKWLSGRARSW